MTTPGEPFTRLAVSLKPEAAQRLTSLRAHLETKAGKSLTLSKVVRLAIDCLADKEGI